MGIELITLLHVIYVNFISRRSYFFVTFSNFFFFLLFSHFFFCLITPSAFVLQTNSLRH